MTIHNDTKNVLIGLLSSVMIVTVFCFTAQAYANDGTKKPTKEQYEKLELIKDNQDVLEENRAAHEKFMEAKNENEKTVRELNKDGWNVDWATLKLIPSF